MLTGLPTRALLCDHFNQAIAIATRRHQQVVLLFLDLDGFKHINDTLGHTVGDAILQQVALRLTNCIRRSDTACRFGGDEFVVLLPEHEGKRAVATIAQKIRAQIAAPFVIDGVAIEMTTSLGMATYPTDDDDLNSLIQACDEAMYRDKARNPKPPSILKVHPDAEISSWEPALSTY
jgi:diguanylate cyclase (GGDEF)-like protein